MSFLRSGCGARVQLLPLLWLRYMNINLSLHDCSVLCIFVNWNKIGCFRKLGFVLLPICVNVIVEK